MKLYTALSLIGFGLGVAGLAAAQGCSSSSSSGGTATPTGKEPPSKPDAPAAAAGSPRTFAVNSIQLGEADRAGVASTTAWQQYGFDLDGLTTAKTDTNVCTKQPGAQASYQEDGPQGIDNSFGKTIIPFLQPFSAAPSKTVTDSLTSGTFTILLQINGLTDDPAQTNTGLGGTLLIGGEFDPTGANKPTFSKSDDWPVRQDVPAVAITDAYMNAGTFVNGAGGATVTISLNISGQNLSLTVNRAIITFDHKSPGDATNGTIAGVLATDELITGIGKVAGNISTQLCTGSTLQSIETSIKQASDILKDGTNKAGVPCDGISVGIGFTAKEVANPTKQAPPATAAPDPCAADGGTDGGQ